MIGGGYWYEFFQNHARENATVLGVIRIVSDLCGGPRPPQMSESGYLGRVEIDLRGQVSTGMN